MLAINALESRCVHRVFTVSSPATVDTTNAMGVDSSMQYNHQPQLSTVPNITPRGAPPKTSPNNNGPRTGRCRIADTLSRNDRRSSAVFTLHPRFADCAVRVSYSWVAHTPTCRGVRSGGLRCTLATGNWLLPEETPVVILLCGTDRLRLPAHIAPGAMYAPPPASSLVALLKWVIPVVLNPGCGNVVFPAKDGLNQLKLARVHLLPRVSVPHVRGLHVHSKTTC